TQSFRHQTSNLKVNIIGYRPHSEIPHWLKAADILVLPNTAKDQISKYYTSPVKMFEYMASERPIVASDLPSIRDILNEENAFFFEPDNPKDLALAIEKLLKDKALAESIATKAHQDVQYYTWSNRAKEVLDLISRNSHLET
ncbi:MAG: glycosyltransferase, partial [Candidatus Paceibacterales bacterium]